MEKSDLGITFTTDPKFTHHIINKVIHIAFKMTGIISHTFRMLTPHTLHLLYAWIKRVLFGNHIFLKTIELWRAMYQTVTKLSTFELF